MAAIENIVWGLSAAREAADATQLAERAESREATSEQFVRIRLVTSVEDDTVDRRVHHAMKGNRELDNAEARPEVSAGNGGGGDDGSAQLLGNLVELCAGERLQAGWAVETSE
jgi:hypothetical protein